MSWTDEDGFYRHSFFERYKNENTWWFRVYGWGLRYHVNAVPKLKPLLPVSASWFARRKHKSGQGQI